MDRFESYICNQSPKNFNYNDLKIVDASRHSTIMPWHLQQVSSILAKEMEPIDFHTIVDCNAHIGGDSIVFRLLYPTVPIISIELDEHVCSVLQENINNLKKITNQKPLVATQIICGDCLDFIETHDLENHVVYFDPPWGKDYFQQEKVNLHLSGVSLGDVINFTLFIQNAEMVIAKLPYNFDFQLLRMEVGKEANIKRYEILTPGKKVSYILAFITRI